MPVPSGVIIAWPSTVASIPAGWSRVTSLDARYVQQIVTSSTPPGSTGGTITHGHDANSGTQHNHSYTAATHTWSNTACTLPGFICPRSNSLGVCAPTRVSHNHSVTASGHCTLTTGCAGSTTWATITAEPTFLVVIFIKSDGSPAGLPNNGLAFMNAAAPTGWTEYVNARNRVLKGAGTGADGGGTGGTGDAHSHTLASHVHTRTNAHTHTGNTTGSHTPAAQKSANTGSIFAIPVTHTHPGATSGCTAFGGSQTCSAGDTSGTADVTPPWQKMLGIQNTSGGVSSPVGVICMWDGALGSIPSGWRLCDGGGGTPNLSQGKFTRGANGSGEIGNTGGVATHNHSSGSHSHGDSTSGHTHTQLGASCNCNTALYGNAGGPCCNILIPRGHTHAAPGGSSGSANPTAGTKTITSTANTDNNPTWTGVAYIQLLFVAVSVTATVTTGVAIQKTVFTTKLFSSTTGLTINKLIKSGSSFTLAAVVSTSVNIALVHLRQLPRVRRAEVAAPGIGQRQEIKRAEVQAPGVARRIDE